jgi:hypothetical protein
MKFQNRVMKIIFGLRERNSRKTEEIAQGGAS